MTELPGTAGLRLLLSTNEMTEMFATPNVSTISNWRARHTDFPSPVIAGHHARFDLEEVLAWARRPDTPAHLTPRSPEWWWAKTVDALRTDVEVRPGRINGDPLRGYLTAVVLIRAALTGDLPPIGATRQRWKAIRSSDDPAAALAEAAVQLETSKPALSGLLVAALDYLRVTPTVLTDVFTRLDDAANQQVSPRRQFEIIIEQTSTAAHPRTISTTTETELATVIAACARTAPGDVLYDPCAGEGRLLLTCARSAAGDVTVFGQELDEYASRIARSRFLLEPIVAHFGRPGRSSIGEDQYPDLGADVIVADPPVNPKLRLLAWVEHALAHLSTAGRCVITIPAHAVTLLPHARRRPEDDLQQRLLALAHNSQVTSVTVVPARLRRDINGPLTIWELSNQPRTSPTIELRTTEPKRAGLLSQPAPIPVRPDQLFTAIATSVREFDSRSQRTGVRANERSTGGTETSSTHSNSQIVDEIQHAVDALAVDLKPLLDRLPSADSYQNDRIRQHLNAIETAIEALR